MSLYNMLHGVDPRSDVYLAMLSLTRGDVGRFRDTYLSQDKESGELRICVYTRNGGGNREEYQGVIDALAKLSEYVTDWDDDFDCTYATIEFRVPERYQKVVRAIVDAEGKKALPAERWKELSEKMCTGDKDDPHVRHARRVTEPLFRQIDEHLKKEAEGTPE